LATAARSFPQKEQRGSLAARRRFITYPARYPHKAPNDFHFPFV
jgi:hypothetical protein